MVEQELKMKYFLKNIAQNSPMRTILLVLIGLPFWIAAIKDAESIGSLGVELTLTIINSLLIMQWAYRTRWINIPSGFVGATAWLLLTVLSTWHICWQIHIAAMIFIIIDLVISKINIQQEATEQAYTLVLLCLILSPQLTVMIVATLYILGNLLTRTHVTWRALVAMLLAIATYLMYASILRHFGWLEELWMENLPKLPWQWWIVGLITYMLLGLITYLPIKKPSIPSGIIYIIAIITAIATAIVQVVL